MPSRRDFLKLTGMGLLSASLSGLWPASAQAAGAAPVIWRGSLRHRRVALTYDDCYLTRKLKDLQTLLEQHPEVKVTLFPVGVAMLNTESEEPGLWKHFTDQGHEIGYHSWDHNNFGVMSPQSALEDYAKWHDAASQVLGFTPTVRFGRPTYGVLSPSFDAVCQAYGLVNTMWSTGWGGDPADVVKYTLAKARNGDIILLHIRTDDIITSAGAYPWMQENNWQAVTLSQLYDDLLLEQFDSPGCDVDSGPSLTRTCIE